MKNNEPTKYKIKYKEPQRKWHSVSDGKGTSFGEVKIIDYLDEEYTAIFLGIEHGHLYFINEENNKILKLESELIIEMKLITE